MDPIARILFRASTSRKALQTEYLTPGTYSFVVPAGVTSISAVCVGAGGSGCQNAGSVPANFGGAGGGGALSYVNNISVTPGETLTVVVGAGGAIPGAVDAQPGNAGGLSRIHRSGTDLVVANGGAAGLWSAGGAGGTPGVGTGGSGGPGGRDDSGGGGGGAGGYAGNGGTGASLGGGTAAGTSSGGAGGGGSGCGGGGVGLKGLGSTGSGGGGGGGGSDGEAGGNYVSPGATQRGGRCGGGSPGATKWEAWGAHITLQPGGDGGIRIIWGASRSYPSTNTADQFE